MITAGGKPVSLRELSERYPSRGIEIECARILSGSPETYRYPSLDAMDFEFSLRNEIVSHAAKLIRSGLEFETFRKSYCNTKYWLRTADGGFDLKRGTAASNAVRDIYVNGKAYATECATAMQIVYYGALLSEMGDSVFNRSFTSISLMDWHKLSPALKETGVMRPAADMLPGDRRYFANPDVNLLTPEWQGENVIDMGDGTYYGHGMGRHSADYIIAELNQNRKRGASRSAYLMPTAGRPDFMKIYNMMQ